MKELNKYILNKIKADKVAWNEISRDYKLSEEFIRQYQDKVKWSGISRCQKLSEDFIREFKHKVKWANIAFCQVLSDDFIREFHRKLNWKILSSTCKLSEEILREFQNKVCWDVISACQFSENFVREFKNKLHLNSAVSYNNLLSDKFIIEFQDEIDFSYVIHNIRRVTYEKEVQYIIIQYLLNNCHYFNKNPNPNVMAKFTPYMKEQYTKYQILI